MKLILHIESLDDAILAVRTAKALVKHDDHKPTYMLGCFYENGPAFAAIRRGKSGTITVYQQSEPTL